MILKNPLRNPLNDLYAHKDEVDPEKVFIVANQKTKEELARFNVFQIPELANDLLERPFKGSNTTPNRKLTTLFVE